MPRPAQYRLKVDQAGLRLTVTDEFWDNSFIDEKGTTQLDLNIAAVVQEIRAALYYIGTDTTHPH